MTGRYDEHNELMDRQVIDASRAFVQTASRLPTLFSYDDQMLAILELIEDAEARGEEPGDALESQLALMQTAMAQKVEGYVSVIRNLDHLAAARKEEATRLRARAATAERAADWLKARLLSHLQLTGQRRVETARFTVSVVKNGVPSCSVLDEQPLSRVEAYDMPPADVPLEYIRVVTLYKVDRKAIAAHVKETGEIVPGVSVVQGEHLRIT